MDSSPAGPSPSPSNQPELARELAGLEAQIDRSTSAYQANLLTHAADLCAEAGERAGALAYYGRAIDGYLATGRHHAASAVCRKILELSPAAVRAHCTLAWLALAREDTRRAVKEIRGYVAAARAAGQAHLATRQLVLLSKAATSRDVQEAIALELLDLQRSDDSEAIVRALYAGGDPASDALQPDASDIWAQALRAVRMTPYDLAGDAQAAPGTASPGAPASTLADALRADPKAPPALREMLERLGRDPDAGSR